MIRGSVLLYLRFQMGNVPIGTPVSVNRPDFDKKHLGCYAQIRRCSSNTGGPAPLKKVLFNFCICNGSVLQKVKLRTKLDFIRLRCRHSRCAKIIAILVKHASLESFRILMIC